MLAVAAAAQEIFTRGDAQQPAESDESCGRVPGLVAGQMEIEESGLGRNRNARKNGCRPGDIHLGGCTAAS